MVMSCSWVDNASPSTDVHSSIDGFRYKVFGSGRPDVLTISLSSLRNIVFSFQISDFGLPVDLFEPESVLRRKRFLASRNFFLLDTARCASSLCVQFRVWGVTDRGSYYMDHTGHYVKILSNLFGVFMETGVVKKHLPTQSEDGNNQ